MARKAGAVVVAGAAAGNRMAPRQDRTALGAAVLVSDFEFGE